MTNKAPFRFTAFANPVLAIVLCACNRPAVKDAGKEKPTIDHANFATSCVGCHESERPAPVDVTPHGNGQDCAVCHRYVTANPNFLAREQFSHVPPPTSCISCHDSFRPKAEVHPDRSGDCAACHAFPSFKPAIFQ